MYIWKADYSGLLQGVSYLHKISELPSDCTGLNGQQLQHADLTDIDMEIARNCTDEVERGRYFLVYSETARDCTDVEWNRQELHRRMDWAHWINMQHKVASSPPDAYPGSESCQ